MKIFKNLYSQWNFPKFDYKKPVWVNSEIISSLKKRSKLSKKHYNNPKNNNNKTLLVNKGNEGIRLILLTKFTKVWPATTTLILKLQTFTINFDVLKLLSNYLKGQQEHVISNEHTSSWKNFSAGVQQGSVWGSFFFLNYINTLTYQVR